MIDEKVYRARRGKGFSTGEEPLVYLEWSIGGMDGIASGLHRGVLTAILFPGGEFH